MSLVSCQRKRLLLFNLLNTAVIICGAEQAVILLMWNQSSSLNTRLKFITFNEPF